MRTTVTGGAGFIGANLCRTLVAAGVEVTVLDDFSTGRPDALAGVPVRVVRGSIVDRAAVEQACRGADAIVHLAALASVPLSMADPVHTHAVNSTGTVHVLEAARTVGAQLVLASTAAVYGASDRRTTDLPAPASPYAGSKLGAEAYALTWQSAFDVPVAVYRFFNVYGPWQRPDHVYASVVPAFVSRLLCGEPLIVYGDGLQTRDFIHVEMLCEVLARTVRERVTTPSPVDVSSGTTITILDLIAGLERAVGRSVAVTRAAGRPGDVRDSRGDPAALRAMFPDLRAIELGAGLQSTIEWYRERCGPASPAEMISSGSRSDG